MLKTIFILPLLLGATLIFAQDKGYEDAMKNVISVIDTCETKSSFLSASEKFGHIGSIKKTDWLPPYYAAFCYVHIAMMVKETDSITYYTQKADQQLKMADSISPKNSEIYCLKSLNTIAKINIDFMNRAMDYSASAGKVLDEAEKFDASNPRIFYLRGRYLYGRPEQLGGGKKAALPWFQKATALYKADSNANTIQPHWGGHLAENLLAKCTFTK